MENFKDYFSEHADAYARYRPTYPRDVFAYLASLVDEQDRAWDVGTGNGQAACALAEFFGHVIATDASRDQIAHAASHPHVEYHVAPAEAAPIANHSIDLILAAQAAHWFDLPRFYAEVRRVARVRAAIALLTYALPAIDPAIDPFVFGYANQIVGSYWPPERAHIDAGYLTLDFPFEEIDPPEFEIVQEWTAEDFLNYLGTWSSTRVYMRSHGSDPRSLIENDLAERWGRKPRAVVWPIRMRVGIVTAGDSEQMTQ